MPKAFLQGLSLRPVGLRAVLLLSTLLSVPVLRGQAPHPVSDGVVDAVERARVIDGALALLRSM
jgi:hypothetical protein